MKNPAIGICICLFNCTLVLQCQQVCAQDSSTETEAAYEVFTKEARNYQFTAKSQPLVMRDKPLLNWGNPARNSENGCIFLWTRGDEPRVLGTCFTYVYSTQVRRKHAFLCLSDDPVEGKHRDRVMWLPAGNAVQYQSFVNATPVGGSEALRNSQMRNLARRFDVTMTGKDGRTEQCRLVPQPLYRWDVEGINQSCGAIFSMAIGTDPEAILIITTKVDESNRTQWRYGWGRFTFFPLEARLDGQSVWKVDAQESLQANILSRPDYQRNSYITFRPDQLDLAN